jgi:hypothetical protein
LARIGAALDAIDTQTLDAGSDMELLADLEAAVRLASRLGALAGKLATVAQDGGACREVTGLDVASHLAQTLHLTRSQALAVARGGQALANYPLVEQAALDGTIHRFQAEAVTRALDAAQGEMTPELAGAAQQTMVGWAREHDSKDLTQLGREVLLNQIDPARALETRDQKAARQRRVAERARFLSLTNDGHGSVLIRGVLPAVEGEALRKLVNAQAQQLRRVHIDTLETARRGSREASAAPAPANQTFAGVTSGAARAMGGTAQGGGLAPDVARQVDGAGPSGTRAAGWIVHGSAGGVAAGATGSSVGMAGAGGTGLPAVPSWGQLRADGLMALVEQVSRTGQAPRVGGDRPRVAVTIRYQDLLSQARGAKLVGPDEVVDAGTLRRLACDAEILPMVLGGDSVPLDVGRSSRTVTPGIRRALEERDGGCVFPGCDRGVDDCDCHHIQPWWDGGGTSLSNLVLMCRVHHPVVEPSVDPAADRWEVRLRPDGLPEVLPPRRRDPARVPRLHARHRFRLRA